MGGWRWRGVPYRVAGQPVERMPVQPGRVLDREHDFAAGVSGRRPVCWPGRSRRFGGRVEARR